MTFPNLSSLDELKAAQDAGVQVDIKHPVTGDPLGFSITIAGPDSDKQKEAQRRRTDARMARRQSHPLTAADIELESLKYLAGTIIRWSDFEVDGVRQELTDENALRLFQRYPSIAEQLDEAAGSRAVFMKKSEQGSSEPSDPSSTD